MAQDQGIQYQIFEDNESEISFKPIQNVSLPVQTSPMSAEPQPKENDLISQIKRFISEKKPSLTILTPCYNSTVYVSYMESLIQTFAMCKDIGLQMKVHFCRNDSLVSRARNNLIAKAMADPKTTHILFIDADITWDPSDILKLLIGDKGVIGGIYPIKQYKWDNLSEPEFMSTLMKRKQKSQLADFVSDQDFLKTNMVKYNVNYESSVLNITNNLAKVKHLATGFMMIKREVIETMCRGFPNTKYVDDVGFLHGKENDFAYALFDCGVEEGHYFSEDWMFCHRWSKMGGGVYIDVTINLDHTGIETYKGSYISSVL